MDADEIRKAQVFYPKLTASLKKVVKKEKKFKTETAVYNAFCESLMVKHPGVYDAGISGSTWRRLKRGAAPVEDTYLESFAEVFEDDSYKDFCKDFDVSDKLHQEAAEPSSDGADSLPGLVETQNNVEKDVLLSSHKEFRDDNDESSVNDIYPGASREESKLIARDSLFREEFGGDGRSLEQRSALLRFRAESGATDKQLKHIIQNNLDRYDEDGLAYVDEPKPYWFSTMWIFNYLFLVTGGACLVLFDLVHHLDAQWPLLRFAISCSAWAIAVKLSHYYTMAPLEASKQLCRLR